MRYIVLILLIFPHLGFAQEEPVCKAEVSKDISLNTGLENSKIIGVVTGSPCYEADLKIEIYSNESRLYQYKERFKPHIAVHWEDVIEKDAMNFLKREIEAYNFIKCSDLPAIEQTGDLPYYSKLLVPEQQYNHYKNSRCTAYIHTFKHYEGNRIVVFPSNKEQAIVVR
jgi:hypothetical protein